MLCDTNIISELARPQPNKGVWTWASQHQHIHLSSITVDELYFGLSWQPNPRIRLWLDNFLQDYCTVLAVSDNIARYAGESRGNLQAQGKIRTQADMLIAATAVIHDLTLVTRNIKDFESCGVRLLNPFL
ncbi:MAG: type II toxin-antitoxin system VapC family toxin [Aquificaceae bacterium]|nr:MAG: type II toxin-antitoxin system VapC family toxin [Aquificaceae bacterium]